MFSFTFLRFSSFVLRYGRKMSTSSTVKPVFVAPAVRAPSSFRQFISADHPVYTPENGRYYLYISHACPWAHRTVIVRALKHLEEVIKVVPVDAVFGKDGWFFNPSLAEEPVMGAKTLKEVYLTSSPSYDGRITVPVLFDSKTRTIVNNESSEIIRMLNNQFNQFCGPKSVDLYPENMREEIDNVNAWIYDGINNGVYKTGLFAKTQEDYEKHCTALFAALDRVEALLGSRTFVAGEIFSEADVRLFTTMVRFAPVYECHFKCNLKTFRNDVDYPKIMAWMRRVYQLPGIAKTIVMDHIKNHYYKSHTQLNPLGIVPLYNGPDLSTPVQSSNDCLPFAWFSS